MHKTHYDLINEELYHVRHDSGLDLFIIPKKGYTKYYGAFTVKYGSIDNEFISPDENKSTLVPDGIAHFLEHKMFEQQHGSIFEEYAKLSAYPNAFTTFTNTSYLFTATANIEECIRILIEKILNPEFTDEGIIKEKDIINQEIKMYLDNPEWRVYYNLLDCLYLLFPVKNQVAGTLESVSKINKQVLYKCYSSFYTMLNSALLVVGDVEPDEIMGVVQKSLAGTKQKKHTKPVRVYPHEPVQINKSYAEQSLNVAMPLFTIGIKDIDTGYDGRGLLKKELEISILLDLLFGKSTEFYRENYDLGLISSGFGSDYVGEKNYGYILIAGESKEPMMVFEKVKRIIAGRDSFIREDSIDRIKKKLMGHYISSFDVIENIGSNFSSYAMKNINFLDYINVLKEISKDDLIERFDNTFRNELTAISIVYPK